MGEYPTSMALNLMYPQGSTEEYVGFWFFPMRKHFSHRLDEVLNGMELYATSASFAFDTYSWNNLVLHYRPGDHCLWVLSPVDAENPILPDITRRAASISNLDRIMSTDSPAYPPTDIFGSEPPLDWCYFYQKGDLSRQLQDWEAVTRFWEQARAAGFSPDSGVEYAPFIEGLAHGADWGSAVGLTQAALEENPKLAPYLCALWQRIAASTADSSPRQAALGSVRFTLDCAGD